MSVGRGAVRIVRVAVLLQRVLLLLDAELVPGHLDCAVAVCAQLLDVEREYCAYIVADTVSILNSQLELLLDLPGAAAICVDESLILETVCDGRTVIRVEVLLEIEAIRKLQVNDLLLHRPDPFRLALDTATIASVQGTYNANDRRGLASARDIWLVLLVVVPSLL